MTTRIAFFSDGKSLDDRLSPILVKELRQGMRGRIFVLSFLLLQVFLVVLTLANLAAQDDRNTLETQNGFFWTLLCFALLILTPLRGLVSISAEVKNRTLETIMLTRLTAWRVVFGKWIALFAQSALLVSAVLPYVVLRYFIGGDDVVADFTWLFFALWLSGILIAAAIAISGVENPVIRIIVLVGLVVTTATGVEGYVSASLRTGGWETLGWLALGGFFITALLFELTASGIAPASENHALRRRSLAVLFFLGACLLEWAGGADFMLGLLIALIALIGVCYFDLAEKPRLLPRMARNFARHGWWGKLAGFFLLPGWPSALLFSLPAIPLALGIYFFRVPPAERSGYELLLLLAVLGSILIPIFICHVLWRRLKQVLLIVLFYNIALMALAAIAEGFQTLTHEPVNRFLILFPGLPTLTAMRSAEDASTFAASYPWIFIGNSCVLGLIVALLLIESRPYFRKLCATLRARKDEA